MVLNVINSNVVTGEGQGEVLAEESERSLSSGSSTELIRMLRAHRRRRLCTGLDGATEHQIHTTHTPSTPQNSKLPDRMEFGWRSSVQASDKLNSEWIRLYNEGYTHQLRPTWRGEGSSGNFMFMFFIVLNSLGNFRIEY